MIIVDTGPIVAMGNKQDRGHDRCTDLLTSTIEPLVIPEPLLAEIGYMLGTRANAYAEAGFLRDIADGLYLLESLSRTDVARAAELVESYANLPLGIDVHDYQSGC